MRTNLPLSGRSLMLTFALLGGAAAFADELTICDGTKTSAYSPIYTYYWTAARQSQVILPADSLTAMQGSTVTKIKFYTKSVSADASTANLKISAGYATQVNFDSNTFLDTADYTEIYNGSASLAKSTTDGEWEITLTSPLAYTGGNLVLNFVTAADNSGTSATTNFYGLNLGYGLTRSVWNRSASARSGSDFLPKTTFTYTQGEVGNISAAAISTQKIDFGTLIAAREPKESVVTITNTGNTPLTGTIALDDDTHFSISQSTIATLAAGESATFTAAYKPTAAGTHTATVSIDLGSAGKYAIALSGIAYTAPDGEAFVFDESGYDTKLPLVLTGFATEYYKDDSSLSDFTTDYDYFPTTYRFESKTYYGSGCIAWNHANPMAGADTGNDVLFNRYYYLVTPAVSTGKLWLRALTTDVPAVGCYVKAYEATPMDDGSFTLSDSDLAITWDAEPNQNAWSCGTLSCTKDARIAIMMKYAALNSIIIVDEGAGTALPTIAALPQATLSGRYILSDISGKIVARGVIADESQLSAATAGLQPGVYIIKTATGTKKIMKR